jgi:hypothetical protein
MYPFKFCGYGRKGIAGLFSALRAVVALPAEEKEEECERGNQDEDFTTRKSPERNTQLTSPRSRGKSSGRTDDGCKDSELHGGSLSREQQEQIATARHSVETSTL